MDKFKQDLAKLETTNMSLSEEKSNLSHKTQELTAMLDNAKSKNETLQVCPNLNVYVAYDHSVVCIAINIFINLKECCHCNWFKLYSQKSQRIGFIPKVTSF